VTQKKQYPTFPDFIHTLPQIDIPFPSARGWLLQGEGQQVAFIEFSETVDVPEHSHEEQWEFPVAGSVLLHMEGESAEYTAGENFYIPAGVPHSARVQAGYQAVIFFNSPDRYKTK
jgi:quercetin dioxygenase-like cupin family protein